MIVETPIVFPSGGTMLSGLVVRDAPASGARQIGVMVIGSWLTVKEQMALLYARRLASLGYAAFVFDFAGFGESGGQPAKRRSRSARSLTSAPRQTFSQR